MIQDGRDNKIKFLKTNYRFFESLEVYDQPHKTISYSMRYEKEGTP